MICATGQPALRQPRRRRQKTAGYCQRHGSRSRRPAQHWHDQPGILERWRSVAEYGAVVKAAVDRGFVELHPSGGYLSFTHAGAELFA
jgi:hypothetical protein